MDEKNDSDKSVDDFMLPGFRFHPTDEELVEFYLKMKLQHRPLPIDLIKQVDIYKYDPWDLPKLASTGEKEWYFYCPRDRKYRNSTRPNRVTGSGFWKATGTDRPIYSSVGAKCIGLKKSLVFYRGRAAKGIKTDWMMHEFRLPSPPHGGAPPHPQPRKIFDKSLPPTDSWAICRIFKKINSTANRTLCHNWASNPLPETNTNEFHNLSALNFGKASTLTSANRDYFPGNLVFSEASADTSSKTTVDLASMFFNPGETTCKNSESLFEEAQHHYNGNYSVDSSQVIQAGVNGGDDREGLGKNTSVNHHVWENIRSIGFPFSLPATGQDSWKANLPWDSPSEISSITYSTNKSYI